MCGHEVLGVDADVLKWIIINSYENIASYNCYYYFNFIHGIILLFTKTLSITSEGFKVLGQFHIHVGPTLQTLTICKPSPPWSTLEAKPD